MLTKEPTKQDIIEAHVRIKNQVHRTPILKSTSLNKILESELFFKCENFQKVGAFKFRGASNAILSLSADELSKGVATHSSGNHAAALALAARMENIPSYIVMPHTAPEIKKRAVESYGAKIIFCEPLLESRLEKLSNVVKETGAVVIPPFDNYSVIAGQATCAKEIYEELSDLNYIITPVGVEVFEINGPFFFGAASTFKDAARIIEDPPKVRIIRMRNVPAIDATGLHTLKEFYKDSQKQGIKLVLSGVHTQPLYAMTQAGLLDIFGEENVHGNIDDALDRAREILGLPKKGRPADFVPTVQRDKI